MALSFTQKKRIRKSFGRIPEAIQMPNLIEVQRSSYEQFLQRDVRPANRIDDGLEAVFKSVFPVKDFNERATLEYVSYEFEDPKYDVEECIQRDITYAAPLKVKLRLIVFESDEETGARSVKDIKEQDVYMGDIPLMTDKGTFVVNGTERVIVSQMHRSPGVFFDHDKGKTHSSGLGMSARTIAGIIWKVEALPTPVQKKSHKKLPKKISKLVAPPKAPVPRKTQTTPIIKAPKVIWVTF